MAEYQEGGSTEQPKENLFEKALADSILERAKADSGSDLLAESDDGLNTLKTKFKAFHELGKHVLEAGTRLPEIVDKNLYALLGSVDQVKHKEVSNRETIIVENRDGQDVNWYQSKVEAAGKFLELAQYVDVKSFGFNEEQYEKIKGLIEAIASMTEYTDAKWDELVAGKLGEGYTKDQIYGEKGALNVLLAFQRAIVAVPAEMLVEEKFKATEENPRPLFVGGIQLKIGKKGGERPKDRCTMLIEWAKNVEKEQEEAAKKAADEEEAARKKAEADEAKKKTEEDAKKKAAEEESKRAKEEFKKRTEEEAKKKAEEEAKKKAEEAKKKADEAAKKAADEAAKKAADEAAKKSAEEARKKAEEEAKKKAEADAKEKAKLEAAKKAADEEAKKAAEQEAARKKEAAEKAKKQLQESTDTGLVKLRLDELKKNGFEVLRVPSKIGGTAYVKYGEKRVNVTFLDRMKYNFSLLTLPSGRNPVGGAGVDVAQMKIALDAVPVEFNDGVVALKLDLEKMTSYGVRLEKFEGQFHGKNVPPNTFLGTAKNYHFEYKTGPKAGTIEPPINQPGVELKFLVTMDPEGSPAYRGFTMEKAAIADSDNPQELMDWITTDAYGELEK